MKFSTGYGTKTKILNYEHQGEGPRHPAGNFVPSVYAHAVRLSANKFGAITHQCESARGRYWLSLYRCFHVLHRSSLLVNYTDRQYFLELRGQL